jgi:phospholipid-transporting ATPase
MSDDFVRLVSQANPALARNNQYQPARGGYPPGAANVTSPQPMDPFFDDEDDLDIPDSAFGSAHPPAMQSKESGLPLKNQAAPIAGTSKTSLAFEGQPQGWNFDDEDVPVPNLPTAAPHAAPPPKRSFVKRLRKWRWPWQKPEVLTGERVIGVNTPSVNDDFLGNHVSTSKYNLATFLPKFLFGMSFADFARIRFQRRPKNNSLNTPTFSSFSPRAFSKYPVYRLQIPGRQSDRLLWFYWHLLLKRYRRTWYVLCFAALFITMMVL